MVLHKWMGDDMKAGFKSDEFEMSLPEIAELMDMHTSTIYQIQQSALRKVRLYCQLNNIVFNDFIDSLSTMKGNEK
jgi:DNA-directed RNA polymerase sigma subunit (sigma70/sigma32)